MIQSRLAHSPTASHSGVAERSIGHMQGCRKSTAAARARPLLFSAISSVECGGAKERVRARPPAAGEPSGGRASGEQASVTESKAKSAPVQSQDIPCFFTASDAPDPLACTSPADCEASRRADDTGCRSSYRDMNEVAMSRAYRSEESVMRSRPRRQEAGEAAEGLTLIGDATF